MQITALPGWLCLCVCMARASQGLVGEASTAGFLTKTRVKNPQFREYWEILKKSRIRVLEILIDWDSYMILTNAPLLYMV